MTDKRTEAMMRNNQAFRDAMAPPEPAVTEYSVKIWYRSGAYEGAPHCPEELARKIYADAAASDGVEFAELHGPSGMLVESKVPHTCNAAGDAPNSQGTERCDLPSGHAGRHYEGNLTWPNRNEEQHVSDPDEWTEPQENLFLTGLPLLHPAPLPPVPELDYRDAACVAGDED